MKMRVEAARLLIHRAASNAQNGLPSILDSSLAKCFANDIARASPRLAHAVLTAITGDAYNVSVRAPIAARTGADALCRQFATGGGRAGAAGINRLPRGDLPRFVQSPL